MAVTRQQQVMRDDGKTVIHREKESRALGSVIWEQMTPYGRQWRCEPYYGCLKQHESGFPIGGHPWALLSISALSEVALHDWRDFQQLKNLLVGEEWEAVELYPTESRLVDPSNRYYLWCAPKGVFAFGFNHRKVIDMEQAAAPQRPFPKTAGTEGCG